MAQQTFTDRFEYELKTECLETTDILLVVKVAIKIT